MKFFLAILVCSMTLSNVFAKDLVNESMQGIRKSTGEECVLAHRQLDYSYPELFISFHSQESERFKVRDAGLLEAEGLDYPVYKLLLYGNENVTVEANKGIYNYTIQASTKDNTRTVKIEGVSNTGANVISSGIIVLRNNEVESITITKQEKSFFGGWKVIFQDTCNSITKNNN